MIRIGYQNRWMRRAPAVLAIFAVSILFVPLFLWAFSERWFYPQLWPGEWGLRAWRYAFGTAGAQIRGGIAASTAVAAVTALAAAPAGTLAGRALGLYAFRGKDALSILLAVPVIVPPLSVAMGLHLWFIRLGLAETFAGVVLVHLTVCLPYAVFVMWGVFSNYDPEFEEQARSLGASRFQVARRVTLPLIWPGLVVAGLFTFLLSWTQYLSTLIIGGGRVVTLPIVLFSLMNGGDRPVAAAVSLVFVAPALLALILSARYLGGRSAAGIG
ncbi:MAG: ABC transporter permease [Desulfococcaceae bacterium]